MALVKVNKIIKGGEGLGQAIRLYVQKAIFVDPAIILGIVKEYRGKRGGLKETVYKIDTKAGSGVKPFITDEAGKTALGL
jgi:hypothetical protein